MLRHGIRRLAPLKTQVPETYMHPLKVAAAKPVYQREHCPGGSFDGLGELMEQSDKGYAEGNPFVVPHWYEPVSIINRPTLRIVDDGMVYEDRPNSAEMQAQQIALYFEEKVVSRVLQDRTRRPVIIDVGANIGLFAREVVKRRAELAAGEEHADVWCVEPIPATQVALRMNFEAYPPGQQPKVLTCGVGRACGFSTFYVKRGSSPTATCRPEDSLTQGEALAALGGAGDMAASFRSQRADSVSCEVRTLSSIIAQHSIPYVSLLKVDVEGAELDALEGLTPEDWSRIDAVVVEVHNQDGGRLRSIRELLSRHGLSHQISRPSAEHTSLQMLWAARERW